MKKNTKTIEVKFSQIYNNPTFENLFNRYKINLNEWIKMEVNHKHFSDIKRMEQIFKYQIK